MRLKDNAAKALLLLGISLLCFLLYLNISVGKKPAADNIPAQVVVETLQRSEHKANPISKLNYHNQIQGSHWQQRMAVFEVSEPLYREPVPVPKPDSYHRLVHLDLKGANPKMNYLLQVIPRFAEWGATGLLVEYEDTFPYRGELSVLQASDAYSLDEIQQLQEAAKHHDLEYIPLIQTFGHFEFVLKHEKFSSLREVFESPQALCPSREESFQVVKLLIDQIMENHPNLRYLHIGADEVMFLGKCRACQQRLESELHGNMEKLFLSHVVKVLHYIHETYPNVQPIMWDDMLRHVSATQMKAYNLGNLVEPMVWNYKWNTKLFHRTVPTEVWMSYNSVFKNIWAASAFKGATGVAQYYVDITKHIGNHHLWLEVINREMPSGINFRGYALTGWQRYDHFAVLCELLPAGLPSLAFCLQTLIQGGFNKRIHQNVSQSLGFKEQLQLDLDMYPVSKISFLEESCKFPGCIVYSATKELVHLEYSSEMQKLCGNPASRFEGYLTDYQLQHDLTDHTRMDQIHRLATLLSNSVNTAIDVMERALPEVFHQRAVAEWMQTRAGPLQKKVSEIRDKSKTTDSEGKIAQKQ
ncbi:hexosaminidase D-like [Ptychodera flava]|uniref:hexosaminidase D-like n=1 Tax=Ptychodera flava TaxID=63121 RepID=UPI00396A71E5